MGRRRNSRRGKKRSAPGGAKDAGSETGQVRIVSQLVARPPGEVMAVDLWTRWSGWRAWLVRESGMALGRMNCLSPNTTEGHFVRGGAERAVRMRRVRLGQGHPVHGVVGLAYRC